MEDLTALRHPDAGDLLLGATEVAAFARELGFPDVTEQDVYYWGKSGKLTLGRFGRQLIGSKRKISRELRALAAPTTP
jgi:hypothetical protein